MFFYVSSLSVNSTKWLNTLKQLLTKCFSVFEHFVGLALNELEAG